MTLVIFFICTLANCANAETKLADLYQAALKNSEQVRASGDRERIAELRINLAETGYLPILQAEAIASDGFAGSTGGMGVTGLIGSPYRSGTAYGLVLNQTIWDFGRTSRATESAREELEAQKGRTEIEKNDLLRAVLESYLDCSYALSERENWSSVRDFAGLIQKEVQRFVRSGQRSIVDNLLVQAQADEAARKVARYSEQVTTIQRRLGVLSGRKAEDISCSAIEKVSEDDVRALAPAEDLRIRQALRESKAADVRVREARAGYMPKLVAIGSVGQLQDARLVQKKDYSVGVGLILPLYDGGKTNAEVDRAQAQADEAHHRFKAAEQERDLVNSRLDEVIRSLEIEVGSLKSEYEHARTAYSQARGRYFSLQGNLVDLRESIRNLAKIQTEYSASQAQLLRTKGIRLIVNGKPGG